MAFVLDEEMQNITNIKVIGVGGGGGNAVNRMVEAGLQGVEFIAMNTDQQALLKSHATQKVQLGAKLTKGRGAGADPEIGQRAAEESKDEIENAIKDADMVFITAGMGGGTGTGAAPVVAEIAQSLDKLTIAVVTKPFKFEGAKKMERAEKGIEALIKHVDALIVIPNQNLITNEMRLTMKQSYAIADEVLKTEASVQDVKKPETLKEHKGVLEFSHVDFKYTGAEHNVLSDIDFKVEPGKITAIIGSTGCGKSTLVNLIPRFYDVTGGQITLDGKDIRRISMEELREEIGFVPQKGVLFSGTIASNLRFGKADATDEDIKEAAQIAQATEFIETKKEKYDSPIAQGGSNVSGGQKQRLAIARAIAKKAKVLVFDDSFSALDMKTDAALRKELNEKVQDASIVIVAQRVSTILHADQILVLDDGKIVGKGTHEELLKNCEVYLQIAKSQLSEKELGLEKLGLAEEKAEKETNKKEILSTKIDEKENNKLKKKSDDKKLKHKKGGK